MFHTLQLSQYHKQQNDQNKHQDDEIKAVTDRHFLEIRHHLAPSPAPRQAGLRSGHVDMFHALQLSQYPNQQYDQNEHQDHAIKDQHNTSTCAFSSASPTGTQVRPR